MLRRSLHIAVVTLLLFASSAAAFPAEPSKPAAERTVLAALWQKVVALFEVEREAEGARAAAKGVQLGGDDEGESEPPRDGESLTWGLIPDG